VNGFGRFAMLSFAGVAFAAAAALALAGCAEVGSPSVHDMPSPRADTTLTPDQVKQATDDLTAQRDHLNTEATGPVMPVNLEPGAQQKAPPPAQANTARPPATPQAAVSDEPMTAGAYAKP
jgi:hypothetical protein